MARGNDRRARDSNPRTARVMIRITPVPRVLDKKFAETVVVTPNRNDSVNRRVMSHSG